MAKNSTRFSVSSFSREARDIFQGDQNLNSESTLMSHDLPSAETVRNILSFSKALKVEKTAAGPVEIVFN